MIKSITILALLSITGCAGTYFNNASVYAGIDKTFMDSPFCWPTGGGDKKLTSNMGINLNVWRSPAGTVSVNSRWTHHSCVFADDEPQYDGIGLGIDYKFWVR